MSDETDAEFHQRHDRRERERAERERALERDVEAPLRLTEPEWQGIPVGERIEIDGQRYTYLYEIRDPRVPPSGPLVRVRTRVEIVQFSEHQDPSDHDPDEVIDVRPPILASDDEGYVRAVTRQFLPGIRFADAEEETVAQAPAPSCSYCGTRLSIDARGRAERFCPSCSLPTRRIGPARPNA